ncbi:helix-turn-helix domain-containing protein [Sinomicrobium weinanense]|uniref:Helix-turn-helix transcriptional regulator n=1 Tax=Sinomicrobium weinanense TaxID=2842200 RepID=A0A926JQG8_9FLAO|nr:helix-turn-helix transcriptional regulator [Sinomicrobium weinanense]MBC9795423.1 helix-turn-helix transcriptional regulator [Sinomicrobium weinanense]MBU3123948.1 helix-turn-helix domain-containing protein [Sinomicrobium weinanense]
MKNDDLDSLLVNIGKIVKHLRTEEGISQLALGNHVGLSANQVGRIERAEGNPTVKTLFGIAKHYNIDIKEFFNEPITKK